MKIFWSWQSDNHQPSGRYFVRDVLHQLAKELNGVDGTEDADRPDEDEDLIRIDHDTSGIGGSPKIADTILAKIRDAAVFVADVTPVGKTIGGKMLPNPNVMIELGYAIRVLDNERIVLVMNTAEGAALKHLPFDLRHWRAPVSYKLQRDAIEDQRAEEATKLKEALRERIIPSLKVAAAAQREDRRRTHRAPELSVHVADGEEQPYRISQVVGELDAKTLQEVRADTPLQPLPQKKASNPPSILVLKTDLSSRFAGLGYVKPVSEWNRDEVEGYNRQLEHYYRNYEQFLEDLAEHERLVLRTFELKLSLVNAGTLPATDIDIHVTLPEGIILYEEGQAPEEPDRPKPPPLLPLAPGTGYATHTGSSIFNPEIFNPTFPWSTEVFPKERRIHFSVEELKHHHKEELDAVLISFASEANIGSFDINYKITANEPIDPIRGTIRFQTQREDT